MYHQEKDYVFHEDYMTFSSKDVEPMNIPYDRFTTLCKTRHALLFLFGKKLVLWLPLKLMSTDQLESIMRRVPEPRRGSPGYFLRRKAVRGRSGRGSNLPFPRLFC